MTNGNYYYFAGGETFGTEATLLLPVRQHYSTNDEDVASKDNHNWCRMNSEAERSSSSPSSPCTNGIKEEEKIEEGEEATFSKLLCRNRPFRLSLMSYLISHSGEWFTWIASIQLLEEMLGSGTTSSRIQVGLLSVCKLFPNFLLFPFSGVLADARDKRQTMMILDALGSLAPLLYLVAHHFHSIYLIYACTLLQASIAAMYEPCRASLVTLMVDDEEYLKKATTLMGLAWSAMAALGSGFGGIMVAKIGINACFVVDSLSFALSWILLHMIGGNWDVSDDGRNEQFTIWGRVRDMTVNGMKYIMGSTFWPLLFIRTTTCFIYGGTDILSVSFAEEDPTLGEEDVSLRLGTMYFMAGAGCLLGPLVSERFTSIFEPKTILVSCALGFAVESLGCFGMCYFHAFHFTTFSTFLRAAGSCISWVDGMVLLQMFSDEKNMGRVIAIDTGLSTSATGFSSIIAGWLQDDCELDARHVSALFGVLGFLFFLMWVGYTFFAGDDLFEHKMHERKTISLASSETDSTLSLEDENLFEHKMHEQKTGVSLASDETGSTLSLEDFLDFTPRAAHIDLECMSNISVIDDNGHVFQECPSQSEMGYNIP